MSARSGIGFDSHRFEEGRRLVLGGVDVPAPRGLAGHSDADVLAHAVADALLGAAGLEDIGTLFPDTDERWRDADSIELLRHVRWLVGEQGLMPVNVDTVVICEEPKLDPFRDAMRERLADATDLRPADVNVKFTTAEGMGFVGQGDGIAALATASVVPTRAPAD
jgi:2-C-methyl-D-erythritol 2,4-cyclodiphosphate synthase